MPILTQTTKAMKKQSFLALDMLQKEEIATLKGGVSSTNKVCGCVCVGPVTPVKVEFNKVDNEARTSDADCTDCGASNAHRATNELITI